MFYLSKYKYILNPNQKLQVLGFLLCILVGAAMELLSVSLMIPLIIAVLDTSMVQKLPILKNYESFLAHFDKEDLIFIFLILFLLVIVFKNLFIYITKIYRRRFIVTSNYHTCAKLFNTYLHCDYEEILMRNSNEIITNIVYVTNYTYLLLEAFLELLGEVIAVVFLLFFLLFINWQITVILVVFLSGLLLLYHSFSYKKLRKIGADSNSVYLEAMACVREAILGFKEIQLLHREKMFYEHYRKNHEYNVSLEREKVFYQLAPAHITEICVFSALCIYIGLSVHLHVDTAKLLAELSVISLAALRMIPSINRINQNANLISLYQPSLDKISDEFLHYLKTEQKENFSEVIRLPFNREIELKDVCYRYPGTQEDVLQHIYLHLKNGEKIGLVGVSGGGKTTLVDIMLGYLQPYQGQVLVDGKDIAANRKGWMLNIGYIPQMIFLIDGTIKNNILLGAQDKDDNKIWEALRLAQLDDFVRSLPNGLETEVGERGIKLSGGQRQRIGIARALYNDMKLLVFDEATSALDKETEAELMQAIYALDKDKTVVIVSHNINTLKNCDHIYCVEDKKLIDYKIGEL